MLRFSETRREEKMLKGMDWISFQAKSTIRSVGLLKTSLISVILQTMECKWRDQPKAGRGNTSVAGNRRLLTCLPQRTVLEDPSAWPGRLAELSEPVQSGASRVTTWSVTMTAVLYEE